MRESAYSVQRRFCSVCHGGDVSGCEVRKGRNLNEVVVLEVLDDDLDSLRDRALGGLDVQFGLLRSLVRRGDTGELCRRLCLRCQ
jgi:hypothetical protein